MERENVRIATQRCPRTPSSLEATCSWRKDTATKMAGHVGDKFGRHNTTAEGLTVRSSEYASQHNPLNAIFSWG